MEDNKLYQKEKLQYQDLIDLGLKRTETNCTVYERQTGHTAFYLRKKLSKGISIEFNCGQDFARLIRANKEGDILGSIELYDIKEVEKYLIFFGKMCDSQEQLGISFATSA